MYVAGLLIGAATVIRQLAALNLLLICAVPFFWQGSGWLKRLLSSFIAALGFATIATALVYFFLVQGTLQDFWFWTVTVVRQRYLPDGWHFQPPLHQLALLAETVVFWLLSDTLFARANHQWGGHLSTVPTDRNLSLASIEGNSLLKSERK